jgi:oligopeptidase A
MRAARLTDQLFEQVWNSDVQFFHVKDASYKHIASFYLDPYSRPADKRGGAW